MQVRNSPQRRPLFLNQGSSVPVYRPAGNPEEYKRTAILPSTQVVVFTPKAKNWQKVVTQTEVTDQFGLKSIGVTYDDAPIFMVPTELYTEVCASFGKGNYGLDTESDFRTQELRLIQVSNGYATYIFKADALSVDSQIGLPKFLKAKDRVKIGVDIETDARRINNHYNAWLQKQADSIYRKRFEVGGIIDLQNLARTFNTENPGISLKSLVATYLPEFEYKEMRHDSYLSPTKEQLVYAANDAVAPLQIYLRMFGKR